MENLPVSLSDTPELTVSAGEHFNEVIKPAVVLIMRQKTEQGRLSGSKGSRSFWGHTGPSVIKYCRNFHKTKTDVGIY